MTVEELRTTWVEPAPVEIGALIGRLLILVGVSRDLALVPASGESWEADEDIETEVLLK